MKPLPIIDWSMNAEEETLKDIRNQSLDEVRSEAELYSHEMLGGVDYTLDPPDEASNLGKGLLGVGVGAGALYAGGKMMPKNLPTHLGTHAMNFLEGFYKKGANKNKLYAQELSKAIGRLGLTAINPKEAIAYANTGISRLMENKIHLLDGELAQIDTNYVNGEYGLSGKKAREKARKAKNKIIKERHYKVLNDAANRELFDTQESKALTKYRKRKPHLQNWWDYDRTGKGFLKSARSQEVADFITSRHTVGHGELPMGIGKTGHKIAPGIFKKDPLLMGNPKLKYIKWFDNSVSGVLHGAQFNYKTYELLNDLKHNARTIDDAVMAIERAGYKVNPLKDGKRVLFSFSPSIKSNFDWGGYNAVAEWNIKNPTKVRFHATDLRDTPISSLFKGNHVLNYVESKKMNIIDMKEHIDKETNPNFKNTEKVIIDEAKNKKVNIPKMKQREKDVANGKIKPRGQIKTIKKDLGKIHETKIRSKKKLTAKNILKSTIKKKKLPKNVAKYLTRVGGAGFRAAGGIGLAASLIYAAKTLSEKD
jgi:hypothetical protein